MLVVRAELEVEVAVELEVPLMALVVVERPPPPVRMIWVAVLVDSVTFPVRVSVPIA